MVNSGRYDTFLEMMDKERFTEAASIIEQSKFNLSGNEHISSKEKRRLLYTINAAANINFFDFRFEKLLACELEKVVSFDAPSRPDSLRCTEFGYLYLYSSKEDDDMYWLCIESDDNLIAYPFNDFVIHTTEAEFFAETVNIILGLEYIDSNEPYEDEACWNNITIVLKSEYSDTNKVLCDARGPFGNLVIEETHAGQLRIALELPPETVEGKSRIISALIPHESPLMTIFHKFIDEVGRYPLMFETC